MISVPNNSGKVAITLEQDEKKLQQTNTQKRKSYASPMSSLEVASPIVESSQTSGEL